MKIVFDRRQLAHAPLREFHNGGWIPYNESSQRAEMILAAIGEGLHAEDFGLGPIAAVHDAAYRKSCWKAVTVACHRSGSDAIG